MTNLEPTLVTYTGARRAYRSGFPWRLPLHGKSKNGKPYFWMAEGEGDGGRVVITWGPGKSKGRSMMKSGFEYVQESYPDHVARGYSVPEQAVNRPIRPDGPSVSSFEARIKRLERKPGDQGYRGLDQEGNLVVEMPTETAVDLQDTLGIQMDHPPRQRGPGRPLGG